MSTIDNGRLVRLTIPRLFDGQAGYSEGELAFIPNAPGRPRKPRFCDEGTLEGQTVRLAFQREDGPFAIFRIADEGGLIF